MPSATLLFWVLTRSLSLPHQPATFSLLGPGDLAAGTSVAGLVETGIATVTSERFDASGAGVGRATRIGVYGGSWTETTYRIGDLEATNPARPGTAIVLPDSVGFRGVSIVSAASESAVSTPGVRLTLDPMRPAARRSFDIEAIVAPPALTSTATMPPAIAALQSLGATTLLFSGPLGAKVGGVMGLHWVRATHVAGSLGTEESASTVSGTAHLVAALRPHDELRMLAVAQRTTHTIDGWQMLGATTGVSDRMGLAHVTWERSDPHRLGVRVTGGYQRASLGHVPPAVFARVDSVRDGAVLPLLLQPLGTASSLRSEVALSSRPSDQDRNRWEVGARVDRHVMQPRMLTALGAVETVNRQAARVWLFDTPATPPTWHAHETALYARDEIAVSPRLRLEGSVRLESLHASNGSAASIAWNNVYPRAFATITLVPKAGLSTFVGVSRSGGPIPILALGLGDPRSPSGRVYRWTDANLDDIAQPGEYGTLVARVGPGAWASGATGIEASLRRPVHTLTLLGLAVERERWTLALTGLLRRTSSLIAVVNRGAAYTRIGVPDDGLNYPFPPSGTLDAYSRTPETFGLDQYQLTNPDEPVSDFRGLDASFQMRSRHTVLAFSGTAGRAFATLPVRGFRVSESDPGQIDLAANPNGLVNALGRPFFDRAYTGAVMMVVNLPRAWTVATSVRYQDGQPFSRLADVGGLTQGPEPVRAYTPGKTRFTFVGTVDVRVQKHLNRPERGAVIFLDVFDLFNSRREVEERVMTSPAFRSTSAVEPPRSARMGIRLSF